MNTKKASEYLAMEASTLQTWRVIGTAFFFVQMRMNWKSFMRGDMDKRSY